MLAGNQVAIRLSSCASTAPPTSTPTAILPLCIPGYTPGAHHTTHTLPHPLSAVLPLISSFDDISWTGASPSVSLNGTPNTPGTARTYTLASGATVIETLLEYTDGGSDEPHIQVHALAPLYQPLDPDDAFSTSSPEAAHPPPAGAFGLYAARDAMRVATACNGAATAFDLSATFCATNVSAAARWFRARDAGAMGALGRRLGGREVRDCAEVVVAAATAAGAGGGGGGGAAAPTPSAASHQQARMSMGAAVSLVLGGCMAFAALMA